MEHTVPRTWNAQFHIDETAVELLVDRKPVTGGVATAHKKGRQQTPLRVSCCLPYRVTRLSCRAGVKGQSNVFSCSATSSLMRFANASIVIVACSPPPCLRMETRPSAASFSPTITM